MNSDDNSPSNYHSDDIKQIDEFFRDLRAGKSPGSDPNYKQWNEYHYRWLNTLGYMNVSSSEASFTERAEDAAKTTIATAMQGVSVIKDGVVNATKSGIETASNCLQWVRACHKGSQAQATANLNHALHEATIASGAQVMSDFDQEIIENPDFYLFLLTSPVTEKSIRQGGIGYLAKMILQIHDAIRQKEYTTWGKITNISEKIDQVQEEYLPKVPSRLRLYKNLTQDIWEFIMQKCQMSYQEKQKIACDIAQLVHQCKDPGDEHSIGFKIGCILEFAKKYNILEIISKKENSEQISALICDIWAVNAANTESIGFDEKAVKAMQPVIELILQHGLTEKSFPAAKKFVETLVNMISMDHADPDVPVVVDLTRDIFDLARGNEHIRQKLSSENETQLTPQSEGLQEFFRGYFVNLFKYNGLCLRLENELEILSEQKNEAIALLNQKKGQQARVSEIKSAMTTARARLKQALSSLKDFELQLQARDKGKLIGYTEKWNEQRERMVLEGKEKDLKENRRIEQLFTKKHQFAVKHHLESQENEYDKLIYDESDLTKQKAIISDEIERTDFNAAFFDAEKLIEQSREEVTTVLKKHGLEHLGYQNLGGFNQSNQQKIQKIAKDNQLDDQDISGLIANPEIQRLMRGFQQDAYDQRIRVSQRRLPKQISIGNSEKKVVDIITGRMRQSMNWFFRQMINLLCGINLPKCMRSGHMGTIGYSIKVYIALFPDDHSDAMRIMKSLEMIINFNPVFWRDLMAEKGTDIRDLVNYTIADGHGDYVFTRPKHIEASIRSIFEYVIHDAIRNENTYDPVNLLLSTWTDPESFDRRYQELKDKHREQRKQSGRHIGKAMAKVLGKWISRSKMANRPISPKKSSGGTHWQDD